jgi:hypothetical protein
MMSLLKINIFARISLIFFFGLFVTRISSAEEKSALPVSIYQLIANPEKYNGKEIYVVGFMHMEFEGDVLYAHREDWAHTLIQNGIAFDVPKSSYSSWIKINNSYVIAQGTFSATERGHLALRAGSLTNITKLVKWRGPKH